MPSNIVVCARYPVGVIREMLCKPPREDSSLSPSSSEQVFGVRCEYRLLCSRALYACMCGCMGEFSGIWLSRSHLKKYFGDIIASRAGSMDVA
ncbi:hypothetical protein DMENIID0001_028820 [Sergentomyia squamirostris]